MSLSVPNSEISSLQIPFVKSCWLFEVMALIKAQSMAWQFLYSESPLSKTNQQTISLHSISSMLVIWTLITTRTPLPSLYIQIPIVGLRSRTRSLMPGVPVSLGSIDTSSLDQVWIPGQWLARGFLTGLGSCELAVCLHMISLHFMWRHLSLDLHWKGIFHRTSRSSTATEVVGTTPRPSGYLFTGYVPEATDTTSFSSCPFSQTGKIWCCIRRRP